MRLNKPNIAYTLSFLLTIGFISHIHAADWEPCDFALTKNISDGEREPDGTWLHDGVRYPDFYYANYTYVLDENRTRIPVEVHVRGCICLLRHCLTGCCRPGELVNWNLGEGDGSCRPGNGYKTAFWPVGVSDSVEVDILKEFHWTWQKPTCRLHFLDPENIESDAWYLLRVSKLFWRHLEVQVQKSTS